MVSGFGNSSNIGRAIPWSRLMSAIFRASREDRRYILAAARRRDVLRDECLLIRRHVTASALRS
jgi:hypothetical protein